MSSMTSRNTLGMRSTTIASVTPTFSVYVKFRSRRNATASVARAVDADMIMMTGASTRIAHAYATPWAARLNLGSARRAMTAASSGPSTDIMSHVAASGTQKRKMDQPVRLTTALQRRTGIRRQIFATPPDSLANSASMSSSVRE
jgi:hypothetical protein